MNVASIQTTLQSFRNSVTRVGQPDQKVAFVAFGGGANQNTLLKQHLSSLSRVELLTRQGATFNQDLLNWYLNKVVDPVIADTVKRIDPKADADKTFTFIIGNGISVQGTLGQFNKVETKDRLEAEKLMEDSKTWDRSLDVFTKLGFKVDTGVFGGFAKGESDVEFRLGKKDIGTAFRKDYSKDVRDMFQMAEGKFPVVALDVAQFQQSEMATAKAIEVTFNTFTIGRRNLTPSVSFQTLKASDISTDGKFLAFQTELEKRQARLESELAILAAKVGKLDTSKIHIDRVRVHWATPENNPLFTEIRDPQVKGTGPAGSRWLRQPVQFPEGRFTEAPDVVAGLASLEAPPTARVSIRTSEVTAKGFILEVWAWHDTVILEADVVYTAVAKPMK